MHFCPMQDRFEGNRLVWVGVPRMAAIEFKAPKVGSYIDLNNLPSY
jgi:hypothetical protein